jgi:hypothetical protein
LHSRKVIETYYSDICNLADLLAKYVNSYRLLVGAAGELNQIALAKKKEVKDTLDMVDDLGDIIDDLLDTIEKCQDNYITYCKLKSKVIGERIKESQILTEVDEELDFKNSTK